MTTPTLILSPRYTADDQALWRAAIQRGWGVERLSSWRVPDEIAGLARPVLYLEALMAPMLAASFGLRLREPPDHFLPRLPARWRKREVRLTTLGEARREGLPAFVKPPNDKSFPARVYDADSLPRDYPEETPVLVSEVVSWVCEFRCFLLDRECRASSIYLRHGELQRIHDFASSPEEDAACAAFVGALLRDDEVVLPRAVVLDVGEIEGRGWAVVEANAAWGAGIYGCEPGAVLDVLAEAAERG